MPLQLEDLDLLGMPGQDGVGKPLMLPIDAIDEDPAQPRKEFDDTGLQEMAATIVERGVRQPVSVRRHPEKAGRWMLNFGARRLRACRLAGHAGIPAFVDETADSYDQVIENEQREPLKPLELALFVQRRLAAGESQAEIARRLGKSRAYVTYAMALVDAPDWLLDAYRQGRCRGLRELYELRRLHGEHPHQVEVWTGERAAISREHIDGLRASLVQARGDTTPSASDTPERTDEAEAAERPPSRGGDPTIRPAAKAALRLQLQAELEGGVVALVIDAAPDEPGHLYVTVPGRIGRRVVAASRLTLIGFSAE